MTQLEELMSQGFRIKISDTVTPDTVFSYEDEEGNRALVFNKYNYSYLAYPLFEAHHINMGFIHQRIESMAQEAVDRLDAMVDKMNRKYEPQVVTFFPNVEVTEIEPGVFKFRLVGGSGYSSIYDEDAYEPIPKTEQEDWVQGIGQKQTTYQELKAQLGREPDFDELVRGY